MTNRVSPILFKSIAGALFVGVALTGCLFTDNADNINKNALNCTSLTDDFLGNSDTIIREANTMSNSSHPYWWLNSGGYLYRQHGKASTTQQKLADTDNYRLLYAKSNPTDSDDGYHPQNLIRLVTRAKFQNFTQQVFLISIILISQLVQTEINRMAFYCFIVIKTAIIFIMSAYVLMAML